MNGSNEKWGWTTEGSGPVEFEFNDKNKVPKFNSKIESLGLEYHYCPRYG
jgi:hypothetical protein